MGNLRKNSAVFIAIFSALVFIVLLPSIFKINRLSDFDLFVQSNMSLFRSGALTSFFIAITEMGNIFVWLPLSFILFLFLTLKKQFYRSFVLVSSVFTGLVFVVALKELTGIPRLASGLIEEGGFSFPSGHATMTTIFFLALGYLFSDRVKNKTARFIFEIICVFAVISVGFSRIYLGVHRPTEVAAGFLLGVFCVSASIILGHLLCNKKLIRAS